MACYDHDPRRRKEQVELKTSYFGTTASDTNINRYLVHWTEHDRVRLFLFNRSRFAHLPIHCGCLLCERSSLRQRGVRRGYRLPDRMCRPWDNVVNTVARSSRTWIDCRHRRCGVLWAILAQPARLDWCSLLHGCWSCAWGWAIVSLDSGRSIYLANRRSSLMEESSRQDRLLSEADTHLAGF